MEYEILSFVLMCFHRIRMYDLCNLSYRSQILKVIENAKLQTGEAETHGKSTVNEKIHPGTDLQHDF